MKKFLYLLVMSIVLTMLSACNTAKVEIPEPVVEISEFDKKLIKADQLVNSGNYQNAYTIFSELQNETTDYKMFSNLAIAKSNALFHMGKYPAALSALSPMPELPANLIDCRKMIMASRILQKMNGNPEYVEALLEVALENSVDEPGTEAVKATGYVELGKIYVANEKIPRAVKCFEYASKLYKIIGDNEQATNCRNIMEYLQ